MSVPVKVLTKTDCWTSTYKTLVAYVWYIPKRGNIFGIYARWFCQFEDIIISYIWILYFRKCAQTLFSLFFTTFVSFVLRIIYTAYKQLRENLFFYFISNLQFSSRETWKCNNFFTCKIIKLSNKNKTNSKMQNWDDNFATVFNGMFCIHRKYE